MSKTSVGFNRIFLISLLNVFVIAAVVLSGSDDYAYAGTKGSCVTGKCHSTMAKKAFVHGPVAVGQCRSCHIPARRSVPRRHTMKDFRPLPNAANLCRTCHNSKNDINNRICSTKGGKCTICHNPHQSDYIFHLKNKPGKYLRGK